MKGRDRFTKSEAGEIKRLLRHIRGEPGTPQKILRDQLRRLGFYISDWADGPRGFTPSDFDCLVSREAITITAGGPPADAEPPVVPHTGDATPARGTTSRPSNSHAAAKITRPALAALSRPPLSIKEAVAGGVPNRPGLYAIYGPASVWSALGFGQPPNDRPLYVGKAEGQPRLARPQHALRYGNHRPVITEAVFRGAAVRHRHA